MTHILLVGAADTGRAPMAAALLRRLVKRRGYTWQVASAGVLGHDGDPPEPEARSAMMHLGHAIEDHRARSVNDELMTAMLIIAVDSGTARALRARFPERSEHVQSLGALAGRQRDVPDPFRMEVGAWVIYARELESMLEAAFGRIAAEMAANSGLETHNKRQEEPEATNDQQTGSERGHAVARVELLLAVATAMPEVINWPAARTRIEAELTAATIPMSASDLAAAYGGLLRAALALTTPTPGQLVSLRAAIAQLAHSIGHNEVSQLSSQIGGWKAL